MNELIALLISISVAGTPAIRGPIGSWDHNLTIDVTGAQTQFHDWQAGGENSIAWQGRMKGKSRLIGDNIVWDWRYDFTYGQSKRGDGGIRKTKDEIHIETEITRKLGVWVNPFIAADVRTQVDNGYKYRDSGKTRISRLWDPGYTSGSIGGGREFRDGALALRAGASMRQAWKRGDDATQFGLEMVGRLKIPIAENTQFTNTMRAFRGKGQDVWTIRDEAMLRIQVAKFFTVTVSAQFLEDPKRFDGVQIRQSTAVGIGYSLL